MSRNTMQTYTEQNISGTPSDDVLRITFGDELDGVTFDGSAGIDTLEFGFSGDTTYLVREVIDLRDALLTGIERIAFSSDLSYINTVEMSALQMAHIESVEFNRYSWRQQELVVYMDGETHLDLSDLILINYNEAVGTGREYFETEEVVQIIGGDESETIIGTEYGDVINGGGGSDTINGGGGRDVFLAGIGGSHYNGGDEEFLTYDLFDISRSNYSELGFYINLQSGTGRYGNTYSNIEGIRGGSGDDIFIGNALANLLYGGEGDDIIRGGAGDDVIIDVSGNNILDGGDGVDQLRYYENISQGVTINLITSTATTESGINTFSNFERYGGTLFDDTFIVGGDAVADIEGGAGINTLMLIADGAADLRGLNYIDLGVLSIGQNVTHIESSAEQFVRSGANFWTRNGFYRYENHSDYAVEITLYMDSQSLQFSRAQPIDFYSRSSPAGRFIGFDEGDNLRIIGTDHSDTISGSMINDIILAGSGDDVVNGARGNDTLDGGEGYDVVEYFAGRQSELSISLDQSTHIYSVSGGFSGNDTFVNFEALRIGETEYILSGLHDATTENDTIYGTHDDNLMLLRSGDDVAFGREGNDFMFGHEGNDRLLGGRGDDILNGGSGADILEGGPGNDTASYAGSDAGVTIFMAFNYLAGGDAAGDRLYDIDNITGSDFADKIIGDMNDNIFLGGNGFDVLVGRGGDDALYGGNGNDILEGGAGADILRGGNGIDMIRYSQSDAGVSISLNSRQTFGGHADGDTILGIENIMGSHHDDVLTGGNTANVLIGLDGDDILSAGRGRNKLIGGEGADTFSFISGTTLIMDFEDDIDIIDFSGFNLSDLSEAMDHASQAGNHVRFDFDSGDLFILNSTLEAVADDIII